MLNGFDNFGEECSFCGKHKDALSVLIVGPRVSICDECVGLCVSLYAQQFNETREELAGLKAKRAAEKKE